MAPWSLPIGNSVFAKVVAINSMGSSLTSSPGNGAVLGLSVVPDAPINLARDNANTWSGQITLTWSAGASNGGQTIDYYRVSYDQSAGQFVVLSSQVVAKTYTATGLIAGNIYYFKVEAHNSIGYGPASAVFGIMAATTPTQPSAPTT